MVGHIIQVGHKGSYHMGRSYRVISHLDGVVGHITQVCHTQSHHIGRSYRVISHWGWGMVGHITQIGPTQSYHMDRSYGVISWIGNGVISHGRSFGVTWGHATWVDKKIINVTRMLIMHWSFVSRGFVQDVDNVPMVIVGTLVSEMHILWI